MSIFEVVPEDVEKLTDVDLRILVAYVAEQEVRRMGQSPAAVTYGGHQNAGDGGIDVRVDLTNGTPDGYVPRLQTGYQVKAEDMAKAAILKEMKPGGVLRPSIIELGKIGGAYIIVSSKGTLADTQLNQRRNAMAEAVAGTPDAERLYLDFFDRRRLATWVNQHPGLVPWVRSRSGKPLSGWHPFKDWSSSPGEVSDEYLLDTAVRIHSAQLEDTSGSLNAQDGIERIRGALNETNGIVRLVGLSGVGKTRLVQALFDERIGKNALPQNTAIYTDISGSPDPTPLDLLKRIQDFRQQCILIVDNCGAELHRKLAASVREGKGEISLITVEYDINDDEPEGTNVFKLEAASSEVIERLLKRKHSNLSAPEIVTITSFSEGNSRVALALADTAQHGESLANLKDSDLFKRLFRQRNEDNPALLRAAKVCSLVYSFDGETLNGDSAELPVLASLAGQSADEFYEHVAELYRRQLVQKRSKWRALLPHALAHRLAKQALESIHQDKIHHHFLERANERLVASFSRRIGCLHDSKYAQQLVAHLLASNTWLLNVEELNDFGMTVLVNVAPVSPESILATLKAAAERSKAGNKKIAHVDKWIKLLRSLAFDPRHFDEAASLIGWLAGQEALSGGTNDAATGFQSLFQIYLSGTHAPVTQRASVLLQLANLGSDAERSLVLKGLDSMLEAGHFSSTYEFEFGTRKRDFGWHPQSADDVRNWYSTAFRLCEQLEAMPTLKGDVRTIFGQKIRTLADQLKMADEIIALFDRFSNNGGWPEGWVAARSAENAMRKSKRSDDAKKYKALAARLKPADLGAKIASYVLPKRWSPLDVTDVDFEDEKRYEKAEAQAQAVCVEIGMQLAADAPAFLQHLPILLRCVSPRVWNVFSSIASSTRDASGTWQTIVGAFVTIPAVERNNTALCGYIDGLAKSDLASAEALLDEALENPALHDSVVRLQWAAGVSSIGAERLIRAAAQLTVPSWTFAYLQSGRACDQLTGAQFRTLLSSISARSDGIYEAAGIMRMRIFSRPTEDRALDDDDKAAGRDLLARLSFKGEGRAVEVDEIGKIAKACLIAPDDKPLAEQICSKLQEGLRAGLGRGAYGKLIEALATLFPMTVLDLLVEGIGSPYRRLRGLLGQFEEGRRYPLDVIPDDTLMNWAKSGPEERFVLLAKTVTIWTSTKKLSSEQAVGSPQWTPIARKLIAEPSDPLPVLSVMFDRLRPSGWSGSLAAILESRTPLLLDLVGDQNPIVSRWASGAHKKHLDDIERTREWEAKDNRSRDERFE